MNDHCAYCGSLAEGNYSIHRDGFGVGPEVDLCDDCGQDSTPTCVDIWNVIAKASFEPGAHLRAVAPVVPLRPEKP